MRIAHRGGNSRASLHQAISAGVDWLEVDVWWHYGKLVARHDPTIWRLPITVGNRSFGLAPLRPITMERLVDAIRGTDTHLLLDIKGRARELPHALVHALHRHHVLDRSAVCTQEWGPIDEALRLEPSLTAFYSLGKPEHFPAYFKRLHEGSASPLISVNHRLLTAARVAALKTGGVTMIAWTVNDLQRAKELVQWGVDGITSDSLPLLGTLGTR